LHVLVEREWGWLPVTVCCDFLLMAVSDLKIPGETSIALDVNSSSFRLLCEVRG
jgi:hypothetical protein